MFLKPTATIKNKQLFRFAALCLLGASVGTDFVSPTPANAQQMRINVGCPTLGDKNLRNMTIDQINKLCHKGEGVNTPALTCGQYKAMAQFQKINPGFVEGQVAQAVADKYCGTDKPNDALPENSQVGGNYLEGFFKFERGYYNHYSGKKGRICKPHYSGKALISGGRITFVSGGHEWTGTISQNSFISITRDGVKPRPKNYTVINGPMLNAELYNGYCGRGFFRLKPN